MTEPSAAEFSRFVQEAREQRERAEQAEARAAHFESLATDQQRLNEAMVASLKRGLAALRASEAERTEAERGREQAWQAEAEQVRWKCEALDRLRAAEAEVARLREALEAIQSHYKEIFVLSEAGKRARIVSIVGEVNAALAATDRGWAPAGEAVPPFSMHIHGSHLMPVETLEALGRMGAHVKDLYERGWRPGEPFDDAPPAPADQARREGPDDE